jgi:hypothetical protein
LRAGRHNQVNADLVQDARADYVIAKRADSNGDSRHRTVDRNMARLSFEEDVNLGSVGCLGFEGEIATIALLRTRRELQFRQRGTHGSSGIG